MRACACASPAPPSSPPPTAGRGGEEAKPGAAGMLPRPHRPLLLSGKDRGALPGPPPRPAAGPASSRLCMRRSFVSFTLCSGEASVPKLAPATHAPQHEDLSRIRNRPVVTRTITRTTVSKASQIPFCSVFGFASTDDSLYIDPSTSIGVDRAIRAYPTRFF